MSMCVYLYKIHEIPLEWITISFLSLHTSGFALYCSQCTTIPTCCLISAKFYKVVRKKHLTNHFVQ